MTEKCPYCERDAELVSGKAIYPNHGNLWNKRFYLCRPCNAYVGCHGTSNKPLGSLANADLRQLRMRAHAAFDKLWKNGAMSRADAYRWLAEVHETNKAHIGEMNNAQCDLTIRRSLEFRGNANIEYVSDTYRILSPPYGTHPAWRGETVEDTCECPF